MKKTRSEVSEGRIRTISRFDPPPPVHPRPSTVFARGRHTVSAPPASPLCPPRRSTNSQFFGRATDSTQLKSVRKIFLKPARKRVKKRAKKALNGRVASADTASRASAALRIRRLILVLLAPLPRVRRCRHFCDIFAITLINNFNPTAKP